MSISTAIPRYRWIREQTHVPALDLGCAEGATFKGWELEDGIEKNKIKKTIPVSRLSRLLLGVIPRR